MKAYFWIHWTYLYTQFELDTNPKYVLLIQTMFAKVWKNASAKIFIECYHIEGTYTLLFEYSQGNAAKKGKI